MDISDLLTLNRLSQKKEIAQRAKKNLPGYLWEVFKAMRQSGSKINPSSFLPLAAELGDEKSFDNLLNSGAQITTKHDLCFHNFIQEKHWDLFGKYYEKYYKDLTQSPEFFDRFFSQMLNCIKIPKVQDLLKTMCEKERLRGRSFYSQTSYPHLRHATKISKLVWAGWSGHLKCLKHTLPEEFEKVFNKTLLGSINTGHPQIIQLILENYEGYGQHSQVGFKRLFNDFSSISRHYGGAPCFEACAKVFLTHPHFHLLSPSEKRLCLVHAASSGSFPLMAAWAELFQKGKVDIFDIKDMPRRQAAFAFHHPLMAEKCWNWFDKKDILGLLKFSSLSVVENIDKAFSKSPCELSADEVAIIKALPPSAAHLRRAAFRFSLTQEIEGQEHRSEKPRTNTKLKL